MTLRCISSNAAWICGRPVGVVVSKPVGAASETIDVEDDQDIVPAKIVKAGGQVGVLGRGTGGVILQHAP